MPDAERRLSIAEVSAELNVPIHALRQWEARFPQLKPKRDRANRRYYTEADLAVVRRIKELLKSEQYTSAGARKTLGRELRGEGKSRTQREAQELVRRIDAGIRDLLALLDADERF